MAKCFTVSYGVVTPGIGLAKDGTVHVGEEGRARRLVRVKPPEGAVFTADAFGQPVLAEVPGPGVILLIRDHAGFRGGWSAGHTRRPPPPQRTDAPEIACGTAARRRPHGCGHKRPDRPGILRTGPTW